MAEFTVTASELNNNASELDRLCSALRGKVAALEAEESALNGMWEGDAHDTFHAAFRVNKQKMDNFCAAITRYAQILRTEAAKYEAAERANVSIASGT